MTTPTPTPAPAPVPAPKHGLGQWLEVHVVPGLRVALADAEKARKVIPVVEAFLPKLSALAASEPAVAGALAPLVTEAEQILSVIAAL
jgi:gamma-glutamyl:cysteine ligase YbdK (ATP-grasp superfamily)